MNKLGLIIGTLPACYRGIAAGGIATHIEGLIKSLHQKGIRTYICYHKPFGVKHPEVMASSKMAWLVAVLKGSLMLLFVREHKWRKYSFKTNLLIAYYCGVLKCFLKKVHPVYKTPHVITWVVGIAMVIGCLFLDLNLAASLCIFSVFTSFIIVCIGVLILRKTDPDRPRPFRVPCSPLFPALGILLCGTLMVVAIISMGKTALLFPLWLCIGLAIYFSYGYKRNRRMEAIEDKKRANREARQKAAAVSKK